MSDPNIDELLETALHGTWGGGGSHWEDCCYVHRDCAIAALAAECKRLREEQDRLAIAEIDKIATNLREMRLLLEIDRLRALVGEKRTR